MRQRFAVVVLLLALGLTWPARIGGQQAPPARSPGIVDPDRLDAIEPLVRQDIEQKRLPGAVILIGVGDRVVYQKAIGHRALVRREETPPVQRLLVIRTGRTPPSVTEELASRNEQEPGPPTPSLAFQAWCSAVRGNSP